MAVDAETTIEGMAVSCDECERGFQVESQERPTEDGGAEVYFVCPHCEAEYVAARITARGLELRGEIKAARAEGATSVDPGFKALMDAYRQEVSRGG